MHFCKTGDIGFEELNDEIDKKAEVVKNQYHPNSTRTNW